MVKKKLASASMLALDEKIQNYKNILGIKKKAEAEVPAPAINPSEGVGNNVATTVDKLVDKIEAAINEVKELGDKPNTTEKVEDKAVVASGSTEQEVKSESSEKGEEVIKDTSKNDTTKEEEKKEANLFVKKVVAHSTKIAKLAIAQKLADARNMEKEAAVNPAALATLAAILGIGGGAYAATKYPDAMNRIRGEKAPAPAPAPAAPAPTPAPAAPAAPAKKEPGRIPASTKPEDQFSIEAEKAYDAIYDPKSADRLFEFETDPRRYKGSDVYGGISTKEIEDLAAVDAANQKMRESGLIGGLTEAEINEYLNNYNEHAARQNEIQAQRDYLNAMKEEYYGNQPAEAPVKEEGGVDNSLFDVSTKLTDDEKAAIDEARSAAAVKEVDPEQETMYKKLEALDDAALGKLARTNPKMLAALLGALGLGGAGAATYALTRGGNEATAAPAANAAEKSLMEAAGEVDAAGNLKVPTDMLRESGVEIGADGEQRPIDNFVDPNSGQTLDYEAVSKELEDYIKGMQEGDTGVMPWEK